MSIDIYPSPRLLAENFAGEIARIINASAKTGTPVTIALSGGSTPELLFSVIADQFAERVNWEFVHFFWGDERCVPPSDKDSNYGMTRSTLLDSINIPEVNIHRIIGENDPETEVLRYSKEISEYTRSRDGFPEFDLVILGLGEDGHTASIFPSSLALIRSDKICEVAFHPVSSQKRITLTGRVINNADLIVFLVTGEKKSEIVEKIINGSPAAKNFPASLIVPVYGELRWILDEGSSALLKEP